MSNPADAQTPPTQRRPRRLLPTGAIDTHFHVFGPAAQFPYTDGRSYTPPDASTNQYENLAGQLGFARCVIVQPSVYGLDNRRSLSFLIESAIPARAVLVLSPETSESELEDLHRRGVRGVRINLLFGAGLALDTAERLADKIRGLGWHLQILADVSEIDNLRAQVVRLRIPVVFDHLGHVPTPKGVSNRGFQDLLGLVGDGRAWVKLTGAYRVSSLPRPPYHDVAPFAAALLEAGPQQLVSGTDWPHPSIPGPAPDDVDLIDMVGSWVGEGSIWRDLFLENPERLYGFDPF